MDSYAIKELYRHADTLDLPLFKTCCQVISDPLFHACPAAMSYHHCYEGGLAAHTLEVLRYALAASEPLHLGAQKRSVLITSAIWHDYMKIREYVRIEGNFAVDEDYRKIGHITGSAIEFSRVAREHEVPQDFIDSVVHCLLAHHGRREWGSPVEPQSAEALLLHQADMLSAKYGATKESPLPQ